MGLRSRFFAFTYDRFSKASEEAGLAEMAPAAASSSWSTSARTTRA